MDDHHVAFTCYLPGLLACHRFMEYLNLEGSHKDQAQLPTPHRTT